jgi:uncharacterized protein YbcC (UPF0753/DUF2309 family)
VDQEQLEAIAGLERKLKLASINSRVERASKLSFCKNKSSASLSKELLQRSTDWSEIRPEWGLAGNASFVIARRSRTRTKNLQGRSFLHEYNPHEDEDGKILESILTAPMVVTNWINMQYYASALDTHHFGAGNKTIQNVTACLGVIEGNGGDLRTGLSEQSVKYDGRLMHEPIRLQVLIEAPKERIEQIINQQEIVKNLVSNDWLSIVSIDSNSNDMSLYQSNGWLKL